MKRVFLSISFLLYSLLFGAVIDPSAPIGSRKNPAPVGHTMKITVSDYFDDPIANIDMTVLGVLRGQDAWESLKKQSQSNEELLWGWQYIIPIVQIKNVKDLTGKDRYFEISQIKFEFANSDYSHTRSQPAATLLTVSSLSAKLYEGSTKIGALAYTTIYGENCYLYFNGTWFDLGTESEKYNWAFI